MSSTFTTHANGPHTCAKRTLQRLRREAGYRSAKEFAAVLGMPESTYARYERAEEGPGCGIPLAMAQALGVSIDLVVGREDIDAPRSITLDDRAHALTIDGRRMLSDYMDYLESRDAADARARR